MSRWKYGRHLELAAEMLTFKNKKLVECSRFHWLHVLFAIQLIAKKKSSVYIATSTVTVSKQNLSHSLFKTRISAAVQAESIFTHFTLGSCWHNFHILCDDFSGVRMAFLFPFAFFGVWWNSSESKGLCVQKWGWCVYEKSFECLKWEFMKLCCWLYMSWKKKFKKKLTLSGFRKYIISRKYSAGSTSHHYAINHASNMIYDFKAISMDNWQLSTTLHHFLPFQRIRCEETLLSYKWWAVQKFPYCARTRCWRDDNFSFLKNRDGNFLLFWHRKSFFNCFLIAKWSGSFRHKKFRIHKKAGKSLIT